MKLTKDELVDLYLPKAGNPDRTGCPSADTMASAGAGELDKAERRKWAAHVAACRQCAGEYRLLGPLQALAEDAAGTLPEQGAVPRWRAVLPWWRGMEWSRSLAFAAPALMLVLGIGLGVWAISVGREERGTRARLETALAERKQAIASLEQAQRQMEASNREVAELSRPFLNVPIVQLEPRSYVRGTAGPTAIEIPAAATLFTVVLTVAGQPSSADYRIRILDSSGKLVWGDSGLRKSEFNTFTAALPTRLFPAGRYTFQLFATEAGKPVEEYVARFLYK